MADYNVASYGNAGSTQHEELFAGSGEVRTMPVVFASGADIAKHSVVGRVTASGKFVLCDLTAVDGSQTPVGIAAESAGAATADANGSIYVSGDFNIEQLVWDTSFDTDLKKIAAFDRTQISIKKVL